MGLAQPVGFRSGSSFSKSRSFKTKVSALRPILAATEIDHPLRIHCGVTKGTTAKRIGLDNHKVKELHPKKILEFGYAPTKYAINTACIPEIHVAIETCQPSIDQVKKHVPATQIINSWGEIPGHKYDFIFIDSSVGNPHNCAICRDKAIEAVEHHHKQDDAYHEPRLLLEIAV